VNAEGDIPALRKKAKKGKINGPDTNRVNKLSQIALCWRDRKFLKRNLSRRVSVWHLSFSLSLIIIKFAHPLRLLLHHTQRAILRAEKMIFGRGAQRNSRDRKTAARTHTAPGVDGHGL
jgi:hypothetical protein